MAQQMARDSKHNVFADSGEPVGDQLKALRKKAERLVPEKNILSKPVVDQIRKLIDSGDNLISKLSDAEKKEINVSPDSDLPAESEKWLGDVYAAISRADDLLDYCDYHVKDHRPQVQADETKSKETGLICGETIHKYVVKPIASCVATSVDAFLVRPIGECLAMPQISRVLWSETIGDLKDTSSELNRLLKNGGTDQSQNPEVPNEAEKGRSASMQGVVDVSEAELKIVGEEAEVDKIVTELLYSNNDELLSVNLIVGYAETGKTALARAVYRNEEVMFHFDERMWVQMPESLDLEKMAESMLTTLTRGTVDGLVSTNVTTQKKLKDRLKGKRYLLVLDGDFEVNSSFIEFLEGFGGCRGSKMLATVLSEPKDKSWFVHVMKMESNLYCSTLFDMISIGDEGDGGDAELKKSSAHELVKDCQGKLLYIKLLGSLMRRMKGERWLDLSKILKGGTTIPQLCFDSMSSLPLKRCFQFCCFFPKGYLIQREEITELWMAQGYLNNTSNDMLELGNSYYDILLKSGFLEVSGDDDFDNQSCKVPDLLWDVGKVKKEDESQPVHLWVVNRRGSISSSLRTRLPKLRTLCLERNDGSEEKLLGAILSSAKNLRVLIIVDKTLEELPSSVGKLKGLKYLDVSRTKVVRLPDSISVLYNLQTLRLYGLDDSRKSFENLWGSLKHLYIHMDIPSLHAVPPKFQTVAKRAKGSFKVFMNKKGEIDAWEMMKVPNRCSSISIHRLDNASSKTVKGQTTALLIKLEVERLKLHWSARRENCFDEDQVLENIELPDGVKDLAIENFKGTAFPTWMLNVGSDRFHKMVKLELENCSWCEKLPPLGQLRCLKILRIVKLNSIREIGDEFNHGSSEGTQGTVFPSLKVFILCRMKNLNTWQCQSASENAFSSLLRLEVEECPELSAIPDALVQKRLLKLRIAHCKKFTALPERLRGGEAAQEGNEEFLVRDLELFGLPSLHNFSIQGAKQLKSLRIGCIDIATSLSGLPDIQVSHLSILTSLTVWGYGHKELPSWIPLLPCLKILKLELSEKLENFPPEMKALKELGISNCPLFEGRCMRGSRPEWKKVASIPTIVVNGRPHM